NRRSCRLADTAARRCRASVVAGDTTMATHRIALISDLHGNEVALRAVLRDIDRRGADQIACLGDVATLGPRPAQVLALIRERCDLFILGNHDEYMFAPDAIHAHTQAPPVVAAVAQCRA